MDVVSALVQAETGIQPISSAHASPAFDGKHIAFPFKGWLRVSANPVGKVIVITVLSSPQNLRRGGGFERT